MRHPLKDAVCRGDRRAATPESVASHLTAAAPARLPLKESPMRSTTPTVRPATALRGIVRTLALMAGGLGAASAAETFTVYIDPGTHPAPATGAALANNTAVRSVSGTVAMLVNWDTPVIGFASTDISSVSPATAGTPVVTPLTEKKYLLEIGGLADGDTLGFTIGANVIGDYEGDGVAETNAAQTITVYVDNTAPTDPAVTLPNNIAQLTRRPTIVGTAATQAVGTMTVGVFGAGNGGATTLLGTTTVDTDGNYAFTPATDLALGTWVFSVSATDAAGNASGVSPTKTVYLWESPTFAQAGQLFTDNTPALSGTNTDAALLSGLAVYYQLNGGASVAATVSGTGWSHTASTLADGTYTVLVTQQLGTNTITASATMAIDVGVPGAPTLTADLATDPTGRYNTSSTRPVIVVGNLETTPTQLVPVVEMSSDNGSTWAAVSVPASAAFTAGSGTTAFQPSVAGALSDGTYQFRAKQIDAATNASSWSATVAVRVKATVAPPTINPLTTNDATPLITGTAQPFASVVLRRNGVPLPTITADASGDWSYLFDSETPDGVYSMTARQTDVGGAVSALSGAVSLRVDTQSPGAPIITSPTAGTTTADSTPDVRGTAEIGTSVQLVVDGSPVGSTVAVGATGTWVLTASPALSAGVRTISARATDAATNVSPDAVGTDITIASATFAITLSPRVVSGATTPASAGATTSRTALNLLATLEVSPGGATVADVATTTFTAADVVFSPTGSGRASVSKNAAPNGHTWNVIITPVATSGTMSVSIPSSAMTSALYGVNDETASYLFTLDRVKPTVQILANDDRLNATHFRAKAVDGSGVAATSFSATVAFSEKVTTPWSLPASFSPPLAATAPFTLVGATVALGASTDGGQTYPLTVYRVGTARTVSVTVKPSLFSDGADPANTNLASTVFTRIYDDVRPGTPVIASAIGNLTPLVPAKAPSYPCTVTFSEPVIGFTASDLLVTNGIITNFAPTNPAVPTTIFTFTLTPAEGQVSVQFPEGVCTDVAGYTVPASNQFKRVLDSNAPVVAQVTSSAIGLDGFSNAQVPVRVVFSEPMTGFAQTDLRLDGATVSAFAASPGNSEFTFTLWPLTTSATRAVRLIVPAASANDTATNISAASTMITFNYNSASAAFVGN